jgi:hypothetical protein
MSPNINDKESLLLDIADISKYNNEGVLLNPSSGIMAGGDKQSPEWIAPHKHLSKLKILLRNE